jgi:hypothetical protein
MSDRRSRQYPGESVLNTLNIANRTGCGHGWEDYNLCASLAGHSNMEVLCV